MENSKLPLDLGPDPEPKEESDSNPVEIFVDTTEETAKQIIDSFLP